MVVIKLLFSFFPFFFSLFLLFVWFGLFFGGGGLFNKSTYFCYYRR